MICQTPSSNSAEADLPSLFRFYTKISRNALTAFVLPHLDLPILNAQSRISPLYSFWILHPQLYQVEYHVHNLEQSLCCLYGNFDGFSRTHDVFVNRVVQNFFEKSKSHRRQKTHHPVYRYTSRAHTDMLLPIEDLIFSSV